MSEVAVGAGGHHHAQVGRRIAQHVGQGLDRLGRQALGLVDEQHHVEGRLRHLGQPDRERFQARRRPRIEQGVAEARARRPDVRTASASACDQTLRGVLRLRQDPGDDRAVRQMFAPPLRQQRGLAEAGRGLHEDQRVIAQALAARQQARTDHQMALHARRRDLEQQVVRRRGTGTHNG